jgi:heme O synthase-like polyprenyltransferase
MVAGVLGALFLAYAVRGLRSESGPRWARGLFSYSIVYLTLLFAALLFDATPRIG